MSHITGAALDRLDALRGSGDDPFPAHTRVLTFDSEVTSVLVHDGPHLRLALRSAGELSPAERAGVVLLGERDGWRWAAAASGEPATVAAAGAVAPRFEGVRASASALSTLEAGLVVYGAGLLGWHRRARHCGECGARTTVASAGHQRRCDGCDAVQFPRTDPAVITLVRRDDRALLVNQPRWPEDRYAAVAGFVEPGETLEQAVAREVAEEVGLELESVAYLGSQPWPFPHSLMIGFRAVARPGALRLGEEVQRARWFDRAGLRAAVAAGEVTLPTTFSISRTLIDDWLASG